MGQLDDAQRRDWLRLIRAENVGPRSFRTLLNRFGGAAEAIEALPALARRGGSLVAPRVPTQREADAEIAALVRIGGRFIGLGEADYPVALRAIDDAPPLIAIRGNVALLARPMIAIVGSRNASGAGRMMTARLARELGEAGFVIALGLARGIDTAAHEASIGTGTLAVLAGGHDRPYPPENVPLLERIAAEGVALSEMPLGWEPRARDFPRRNRLVSGVSLGIVVVEAADRSGSLITARLAGEQGREVFAVPGSPLDPRAAGANRLLKQGATLVTEPADVIDALAPLIERPPDLSADEPEWEMESHEPSDDARGRVIDLLGPTAVAIDDLAVLANVCASDIMIILLELELAGRLTRHLSGRVSLL